MLVIVGIIIIMFLILLYMIYRYMTSPSRKVCICMSANDAIKDYATLSEQINRRYANKHGYDFEMFDVTPTGRAPQWCKIQVVNDLLSRDKYDYIFWIDADAYFNKQDIPLDDIISQHPDKDVILCEDNINSGKSNTVNSGTFFVKCSPWSKAFFEHVWNYEGIYRQAHFHEQTVIEQYINQDIMESKQHIIVKPCKTFNSIINVQIADGTLKDNFIIHLMAMKKEDRIEYMTEWLNSN